MHAIADPDRIEPREPVEIACAAPDDALLFVDRLNALIFEVATRGMLLLVARCGSTRAISRAEPRASRSTRCATRWRSRSRASPGRSGPGHADLPQDLREFGQPALIGGSMGTESWVLVGTSASETRAFASAVHGAGRSLSAIRRRVSGKGAS
jgi:tRNA-splicing ligase RtcB